MKLAKKILAGVLLLLLAVLVPSILQPAKDQNFTPYSYPVVPGTDEWKSFNNHQDMLDACQIPSDDLKSLSTPALVETVFNYPLLKDMICYDSYQKGYEAVRKQFNGIVELEKRPDSGRALFAKYVSMKEASNPDTIKLSIMEQFLAQDVFNHQLNSQEKEQLATIKY